MTAAMDREQSFIQSLKKVPNARTQEELDIIYFNLRSLEALSGNLRTEAALRSVCRSVRYDSHDANDVLYCRGEVASCWYILLAGSVFIDGSMYLPKSSFGKRVAGCTRRPSECLILEPSEMVVVDYPEMSQPQRSSRVPSSMAVHVGQVDISVVGDTQRTHRRFPSDSSSTDNTLPLELQSVQSVLQNSEHFLQNSTTLHKRHSRASDTSSAYSGSDVMLSSIGDDDDFSGLRETCVDSDDEEGYTESPDSLIVRDTVRECLEKEPTDRTEDDIETLLDFMQHFPAFANMTLATRRALCAVMVFAVVDKADTIVMNDGEELDSWSVILNGHVEVQCPDGSIKHYHLGDSFGISQPTLEKQYHKGVMRTKVDDCQFVCIEQEQYYKILHQGEENTQRVVEAGQVVLVTEQRVLDNGSRKGRIVIRGDPDKLTSHLVEDHSSVDPTYVEDFLLTYRTFLKSPLEVADKLLDWFSNLELRPRVTRVVLLWVNEHFNDFETEPQMSDFLEKFEQLLEKEKMGGQRRLLNIACAAKARPRTVVLTRATREEILHFSVLGGMERGCGIFITKVERESKAHEAGLKRGDQILEVNNHSFERISHSRALDILRGTTHLSITVKSNLLGLKRAKHLRSPSGTYSIDGACEASLTPNFDPFGVLGVPNSWAFHEMVSAEQSPSHSRRKDQMDGKTRLAELENSVQPVIQSPAKEKKELDKTKSSSISSGHKTKIRKALAKFNFLPGKVNSDSQLNSCDDNSSVYSKGSRKGSTSSNNSSPILTPGLSASNPDLSTLADDGKNDYPEHVLKVYKADQTFKYLLVHRETSAREVVMLALKEFGITDASSDYSLCEVTAEVEGVMKQKRLPDQMSNLPDRVSLNGRYYLKNNMSTDTLVPDELANDLLREGQISFLQLNLAEIASQLTLRDFHLFRDIEPTEYIDDLFERDSRFGSPHLGKFSELVNHEMFWVVTEVCSELNVVKRMKIIKHFIKIARHCKECKNFNSMFAIISGLGHGSVSRLKSTWDKVPSKYVKMFEDLQELMDPSRNMSKYRNLVNNEKVQPPLVPFFPVVKKDLTFIHLGNDSKVEGLVNFEKLRMIAKEVRHTRNMASVVYDVGSMYSSYGTSQSVFSAFAGSNAAAAATLRRKRRNSTVPNTKKMFEEAQMLRRVRAYLEQLKVMDVESRLAEMSLQCEPPAAGNRKRDPSPSPASLDDRINLGPKFARSKSLDDTHKIRVNIPRKLMGAEEPEQVRKLMSLSSNVKTRNPKHHLPPPALVVPNPNKPSPSTARRPVSPRTNRPRPPVAVNLSSESSSIVGGGAVSNGAVVGKKNGVTSSSVSNDSNSPTNSVGSYTQHLESDSGHNSLASSSYDTHSVGSNCSNTSPLPQQKRIGSLPPESRVQPPVITHNNQTYHPPPAITNHYQKHPQSTASPITVTAPVSSSQCGLAPAPARPPLPPYHVVMQNNPAYSQYVQQQYHQLLRAGSAPRPPVPPDYHVATQRALLAKQEKLAQLSRGQHSNDAILSSRRPAHEDTTPPFPAPYDLDGEDKEFVDDFCELNLNGDLMLPGQDGEQVSAV